MTCYPSSGSGKATSSDYIYRTVLKDGRTSYMTKIWYAGWAIKNPSWIK
jgi:hypothetical protein